MNALNETVTFLLVDDHAMYRLGMRRLIERRSNWRVVAEAESPEEALRMAVAAQPKVAIVDLRLKDGDGLELVRQLTAAYPAIKVLVSSAQDEELFAVKCLQAGASGYVAKHAPVDHLISAVEKALSGGIYLSEGMTEKALSRTAGKRVPYFPLETLTPREREVYERIGRGQSVKQIAGALDLSTKTVEYHRQQLKKKLQLSNSSALTRHAMVNPLERSAAETT